MRENWKPSSPVQVLRLTMAFFNAKLTAVEKAAGEVVETLKRIVDEDG